MIASGVFLMNSKFLIPACLSFFDKKKNRMKKIFNTEESINGYTGINRYQQITLKESLMPSERQGEKRRGPISRPDGIGGPE